MLQRVRKLKSGKLGVGYYYDGRDADGKRQEVPLGTDLAEAKLEWARLEHKAKPKVMATMGELIDRYERDIIPAKSLRTQKDNKYELERLRKAFADAPIQAISPPVIAQYRDARTAKTRANREIALLSHVFTMAMEWALQSAILASRCAAIRRRYAISTGPTKSGMRFMPRATRVSRMPWTWPTWPASALPTH